MVRIIVERFHSYYPSEFEYSARRSSRGFRAYLKRSFGMTSSVIRIEEARNQLGAELNELSDKNLDLVHLKAELSTISASHPFTGSPYVQGMGIYVNMQNNNGHCYIGTIVDERSPTFATSNIKR